MKRGWQGLKFTVSKEIIAEKQYDLEGNKANLIED
jgi:hypothetical protein